MGDHFKGARGVLTGDESDDVALWDPLRDELLLGRLALTRRAGEDHDRCNALAIELGCVIDTTVQ